EVTQGAVTDAASLRAAAAACDVVVHLVSIITGSRQDFERVMKQGTRNLVDAAREAGARRFVLMSALGVSEETRTLTPYYESKWDMEHAVRESGLEHVIFRPSFVFGRDGGVLPTFIRRVLGAKRPTVHVPFGLARLGATATDWLPGAPLTRDQLKMLQAGDNVADVTPAVETFRLGLLPLDEQIRRAA